MSNFILKKEVKDTIGFITIALLTIFITLWILFYSPKFYLMFIQDIHQEAESIYQFSKLLTENK